MSLSLLLSSAVLRLSAVICFGEGFGGAGGFVDGVFDEVVVAVVVVVTATG